MTKQPRKPAKVWLEEMRNLEDMINQRMKHFQPDDEFPSFIQIENVSLAGVTIEDMTNSKPLSVQAQEAKDRLNEMYGRFALPEPKRYTIKIICETLKQSVELLGYLRNNQQSCRLVWATALTFVIEFWEES